MDDETNIQFLQDEIDRLNKQAYEERVNDSVQAHTRSKEAIDLAERINYTKGKAEGYRTFGFSLIRLAKYHEALEYLPKALSLFESLNDLNGQSSIYAYYGIIQRSLGNYAASLEFLFKSLELTQQTGNKENESLFYYHLGVTYKYLGDYETALNYLLQSLSIGQSINYWVSKSVSLKQIGLIYLETRDFTNALEYHYQSLTLMREAGDKWGEAGCLDSIGFIHFKLKDYNKALEFCSQALNISQVINDKKGQGNSLFHLGNIYEELADYNMASKFSNDSLNIRREIEDKKGQAEILLFLAGFYLKENFTNRSPEKALELLNKAMHLGEEIKALDTLSNIHSGFYKAYKQLNQFQEALGHLESFNSIEKEIHSDSFNQKIVNLEITHKVEQSKKEAEIYRLRNKHLENELSLQKFESEKTKAELRLQATELEMQALRAQMNPHFIFNSLNSINRFILQNNKAQASEYLTKFSRLVRLILQNSQAALIPLESELESLQLYLELEAVRFAHHFEFRIKVHDELDTDIIKVPPLIIQPYAENAIWHGLMHKEEKGHLEIELFQQDDLLCCKIIDDGIGRKKAAELKSKSSTSHKSMGMRITADRIAILQQKKELDTYIIINDLVLADGSAGGTEVMLKIPIMQ